MKSEVNYETEKRGSEILYLSFNQEGNCFAVGTDIGFKIFNSNPLKLITERSKKQTNIFRLRKWYWKDRNAI